MSKNYDWGGSNNTPEPSDPPTSQFPAQNAPQDKPQQQFPAPQQQYPQNSAGYGQPANGQYPPQYAPNGPFEPEEEKKKGGAAKKVGITALVLALIAGAGIGGFQVYKNMQEPEPNPAGVSDETALDFARGDVESCEDIPAEVINAVGIKDYSANEDGISCTGTITTADGKTSSNITVSVVAYQSSGDEEASPVDGWKQIISDEMPGDSSIEDVMALISDGSSASASQAPSCDIYGDERSTSNVIINGPTCDVLYPLANQINNIYEQERYLNQNTGFFELKEDPTYAPVQVATLSVPTFDGFDALYDGAPDFGNEVTSLQAEFNDSKFKVNGAEPDGDSGYFCFPAEFTLGEEKDDDSSTFALPRLYVISQSGQFSQMSDQSTWSSLKVGESDDYEYCGTLPEESIPGSDEVRYIVVYSDFNDSSDAVFVRDDNPNVIGAFTNGGAA